MITTLSEVAKSRRLAVVLSASYPNSSWLTSCQKVMFLSHDQVSVMSDWLSKASFEIVNRSIRYEYADYAPIFLLKKQTNNNNCKSCSHFSYQKLLCIRLPFKILTHYENMPMQHTAIFHSYKK